MITQLKLMERLLNSQIRIVIEFRKSYMFLYYGNAYKRNSIISYDLQGNLLWHTSEILDFSQIRGFMKINESPD